jgi:DNA-directed RNA polymerase subunit M/transcription elongation factor TFIIS
MNQITSNSKNAEILDKYSEYYTKKNPEYEKEDLMYEIGFLLKEEKKTIKDTFDLLKKEQMGLSHPFFENVSKRITEMDHFMDKPFEVVEGVNTCGNHKCGSKRTLSYSRQTRSGDEGMSVYVFCIDCKSRYVMNS